MSATLAGAFLAALVVAQDPVVPDEPVEGPVAEPGPAPTAAASEPVGRPPFADPVPLESSDPIVSIVGSGAPEVLVWYAGARPGMEELTWRLEIAGAVGELLEPGAGTVHLMTDLGADGRGLDQVYEYLAEHPGIVAVGQVGDAPGSVLRRRPTEPYVRDLRAAPPGRRLELGGGPDPWLELGLGLSTVEVDAAVSEVTGKWLRHPEGTRWVWSPFRSGSLTEQRAAWHAAHPDATGPILKDGEEFDFPRFDTDEVWPGEVVEAAGEMTRTVSGLPIRTGVDLGAAIISRLVSPARLSLALATDPVRLGGDLWQVDLTLGAPALQPERRDVLRTYPKARVVPALTWGAAPDAIDATPEVLAPPRLVRLAWRPDGGEHFELLAERGPGSGRYGFPGDDLPDGATLRLVVEAPGAADVVGQVLELALDGGRYGRARLRTQLATD